MLNQERLVSGGGDLEGALAGDSDSSCFSRSLFFPSGCLSRIRSQISITWSMNGSGSEEFRAMRFNVLHKVNLRAFLRKTLDDFHVPDNQRMHAASACQD